MAFKLSVSNSAYSNYENGYSEPPAEIIIKFCDELDITLDIKNARLATFIPDLNSANEKLASGQMDEDEYQMSATLCLRKEREITFSSFCQKFRCINKCSGNADL